MGCGRETPRSRGPHRSTRESECLVDCGDGVVYLFPPLQFDDMLLGESALLPDTLGQVVFLQALLDVHGGYTRLVPWSGGCGVRSTFGWSARRSGDVGAVLLSSSVRAGGDGLRLWLAPSPFPFEVLVAVLTG